MWYNSVYRKRLDVSMPFGESKRTRTPKGVVHKCTNGATIVVIIIIIIIIITRSR
jgi:hypothetical protein